MRHHFILYVVCQAVKEGVAEGSSVPITLTGLGAEVNREVSQSPIPLLHAHQPPCSIRTKGPHAEKPCGAPQKTVGRRRRLVYDEVNLSFLRGKCARLRRKQQGAVCEKVTTGRGIPGITFWGPYPGSGASLGGEGPGGGGTGGGAEPVALMKVVISCCNCPTSATIACSCATAVCLASEAAMVIMALCCWRTTSILSRQSSGVGLYA